MNLAVYQSHKTVRAAKILRVTAEALSFDRQWRFMLDLQAENGEIASVGVDGDWVISRVFKGKCDAPVEMMCRAVENGYYVQYDDDYSSWSPAETFEKGYTRVVSAPVGQTNVAMPPAPFRPVYRQLHAEESDAVASIKDKAADLWDALNAASTLPNVDARCVAYSRTKLEEFVMWATKAITK